MKVIAVVGMTGSGKSEAARVFREKGFATVRFGDVTDEELRKQGLPLTEENERPVREAFRKKHGMAAYAILNLPRIDAALRKSNVVVDGLYSWEEYIKLKEYFGDSLIIVAVYSSPRMRYKRLGSRKIRPLTPEEAESRDHAEVENMNKGGPIAMADYTVINEYSYDKLKEQVEEITGRLT
jgi:dephospho-CoA kinase